MLGSGSRTSFVGTSQPASGSRTSFVGTSQPISRRQSTAVWPSSTSPTGSVPAGRPKPLKRFSLPAPVPIPVLPYTKAEWRKTIGEVKRKYFGKRYRACSARCVEVLDGIKYTSEVEPVYLIYLHFYAATSMEICARPLPLNSALRASLLQQARTHFDKASTLINAAEDSVLQKFRPGSASSSRASSCHSPSNSVSSSRAWTPDTRLSSPTESECSFDGHGPKSPQQPPAKRVKKVSFSLPKENVLKITAEPIIRPDSPTLGGFDDFFPHSLIHKPLPELPPPKYQHPVDLDLPLQTIPEQQTPQEEEEDETPYQTASRSVDRCCEHLASLRAQLARHSHSLDQLLSLQPGATSTTPSPTAVTRTATPTPAETEESRRARIERLRGCGWRRKRFDASRYEVLCEAVLAELE